VLSVGLLTLKMAAIRTVELWGNSGLVTERHILGELNGLLVGCQLCAVDMALCRHAVDKTSCRHML
jgi:hypothetical protein